jgi:hypothetical protein
VNVDQEFKNVRKDFGEDVKNRFYPQLKYVIILIMIVME